MSHASCGLSSEEAYKKLMEGNSRFVSGKMQHPNQTAERRKETAEHGQTPFAAVLACSDSRVNAELIFDAGIGDIFPVENAGNYVGKGNCYDTGSLQYAVVHLNVPVLVVMGHTKCGAIAATKSIVESGAKIEEGLERIIECLKPAVEMAKEQSGDWADNASRQNVKLLVQFLRDRVNAWGKGSQCKVAGIYYDVKKGSIEEIIGIDQSISQGRGLNLDRETSCCCGGHSHKKQGSDHCH